MIEWICTDKLVHYERAVAEMEKRVAAIRAGTLPQAVWLLQHPPLYTAGTSAKEADLLQARFPVFQTGRGGQYTYHGPGQRVAYVMLDLAAMGGDIRKYVWQLEEWIIRTLAQFDIIGERREGRIGIWVRSSSLPSSSEAVWHKKAIAPNIKERSCSPPSSSSPSSSKAIWHKKAVVPNKQACSSSEAVVPSKQENKIAALGVRVRSGVTYHGIAINLSPDLSHFDGIVPCGIAEHGVTSFAALQKKTSLQELDDVLQAEFYNVFDF